MIEVPEAFARIKAANEGERGRAWATALPEVVDGLLRRWSCTPTGPVMYGQVGIVVPVLRRDRTPAVVKVSFPHPGNVHDPDAYATWDGRGAVRMFARDDDNFALLLERASQRTLAAVTDPEQALTIQGRLSRRLAVAAPPGLPRLSDQVDRWEHEILTTATDFGNPLPRRVLDAVVATLRELGPNQPDILVHGDLHDANILASDREPWLAIDPKTWVGDPAHDALNVIRSPRHTDVLRSPNMRPTILRYLDIYCDAAELDTERTRRWTQAGAVREAMWGRRHADPDWLIHATDQLAEALA
ncbi:aminoglycoside phosphotransferase family protein [Nocardia mexicana]|uniref:Streptomycin 6-kinase n=1 Tax=Nocardia mexicana TaxID=279262 RepID=A0A370HDZ3_9NOCA|nr:aminoglycoside phosphotransferase family protein [Nocardia mexicana]RDI55457.1 streptomycin 6-kinase [Nocardia mexicana]